MPTTWNAPLFQIDTGNTATIFFIVTSTGNTGIRVANPQYTLEVGGNARIADSLRLDGDLRPAGNPGQPGQVLTSQGPGTPPQWQSLSTGGGQGGSACTFNCPDTLICVDTNGNPIGCGSAPPMNWGACARACATSTAGGFTDWRMPSFFELIDLAAHKNIGAWNVYVWTRTPLGMYGVYPSGVTGNYARYYFWRASDGYWNSIDASNATFFRCACVR